MRVYSNKSLLDLSDYLIEPATIYKFTFELISLERVCWI